MVDVLATVLVELLPMGWAVERLALDVDDDDGHRDGNSKHSAVKDDRCAVDAVTTAHGGGCCVEVETLHFEPIDEQPVAVMTPSSIPQQAMLDEQLEVLLVATATVLGVAIVAGLLVE